MSKIHAIKIGHTLLFVCKSSGIGLHFLNCTSSVCKSVRLIQNKQTNKKYLKQWETILFAWVLVTGAFSVFLILKVVGAFTSC